MIHVNPAPEPKDFDQNVRRLGLRAIAEMVGEKLGVARSGRPREKIAEKREDIPADAFPCYWTKAIPDMMKAYNEICAYSCFRIHPVTGCPTVDHMIPKSSSWAEVYEWCNYRLASHSMNSTKRAFKDVLDPFDVDDGWFVLELTGFQVKPSDDLLKSNDPAKKAIASKIQDTIKRLGLSESSQCEARAERAEQYWRTKIDLPTLEKEAPFVAKELRRQGRLLPRDV